MVRTPQPPLSEPRRVQGMTREELCRRFFVRVVRRAERLCAQCKDEAYAVSVDDLVASGMVGLLDAFERFGSGHNAEFETYANFRINGEMRDALSAEAKLTRRDRYTRRSLERATAALSASSGRAPAHAEIAAAMGLSLEEYWRRRHVAQPIVLAAMAERGSGERLVVSPEAPLHLQAREERRLLRESLARLPERERMVLNLYYGRGCTLAEVGEVLGVTPSRVSQVLSDSRARLRKWLGRVDIDLFAMEGVGAA